MVIFILLIYSTNFSKLLYDIGAITHYDQSQKLSIEVFIKISKKRKYQDRD